MPVSRLTALRRLTLILLILGTIFPEMSPAKAATSCPTTYCSLENSLFRIGSGSENSINSGNFLQQPWYWSSSFGGWRQYTYSSGAYSTAFGVDTGGSAWNGNVYVTNPTGTVSYDYSNFVVTSTVSTTSKGYGTISASFSQTINSKAFTIKQDFILGQNANFLKVVITVTNNSATTATNFNQWVGPSDDYVGGCDTNIKDRGNISGGAFTILSSATQSNQNAVRVTCSNVSEAEYLTSPMPGAKTIIPSGRFGGVPTGNPTTTTLITESSDNGYGLQIPLGDIAAGQSASAVWYLAGGINSDFTTSVFNAISSPLAPSVTSAISSVNGNNNLTNSGSFSYNVTFSSTVTGFTSSDVSFTGSGSSSCGTPTVSGSGASWTVSVTGCSEGLVNLVIASNSVLDTSNNAGPLTSYTATSVRIDTTNPTVSSVTTTNGSYNSVSNAAMNFTIVFSESVTVTGTPRISLAIGSATRFANYVSMTDSKTATFRYTVSADYSEIDLDGISVTSPLQLNLGSITDLASNAMNSLTFSPPITTAVYVNQAPNAPTIDSITANNTSLTVYFSAGASNGSTVSNYKYSINAGAFTALSPTDAVSPITITGLTNGTTYSISIKAVSNLGDGLASNLVSASPTASVTLGISLAASATTATKGTLITITASISQPGKVTFLWNSQKIPGCIAKPSSTTATCQWKPNVTGNWTIQAFIQPTDTSYVNSYSQKIPVFILRRSGNR